MARRAAQAARAAAVVSTRGAHRGAPAARRPGCPAPPLRLCAAAHSSSAGSSLPKGGEGSADSGAAAGVPTPRQDHVALSREAAKLRSQLQAVRQELALSRRELTAARASNRSGGSAGVASLASSTTLRQTLTEEFR